MDRQFGGVFKEYVFWIAVELGQPNGMNCMQQFI